MMHEPIYPHAPGHRGVQTSIEAAEAIAAKLGHLQKLALNTLRAAGLHGCTAEETAQRLELDRGSIQPRLSELKVRGLIVDSKQRRRNANGKRAIVWVLAEPQGSLLGGAS